MKFTILKGQRDEKTNYPGFVSGGSWLRDLGKRRGFWEKHEEKRTQAFGTQTLKVIGAGNDFF